MYLAPNHEHEELLPSPPAEVPDGVLAANPRDFKTPNYGINYGLQVCSSPRQLTALLTFSDPSGDVREQILRDAERRSAPRKALSRWGRAAAYPDAVATLPRIWVIQG